MSVPQRVIYYAWVSETYRGKRAKGQEGKMAKGLLKGERRKAKDGERMSEVGMTLIQVLIILALIIIIAVLAYPKLRQEMYVRQADNDVSQIADACKKYLKRTDKYCIDFNLLIAGGYLEDIPSNPWGGSYVIDPKNVYKVGIPSDDPKTPDKYKLGGIAEISKVYKKGASWW